MSTIRVVNIQHSDATEPNIVLNADGTATFVSGITISGGTNLTVSGTAEFASGTVSAPGITFIDDNNTGIYEPAADTVAITTAATERLRVDNSGNVAIGGTTITDSNLLNIQGSSATKNIGIVLNDTNTSKIFGIQNGGSSLKFFDYTASAERLRIDSIGNVGIGNTSPGAKLQIEGTSDQLKLTYTSIASYIHEVHSNGDYSIAKDSNERVRIDSSGRVGIGTSGPEKKLHVRNDGDSYPMLVQNRTNAVSTCGIALIAAGVDFADNRYASIEAVSAGTGNTLHHLAFRTCTNGTSPQERMRIDSTGTLTVGPQYDRLNVNPGSGSYDGDPTSVVIDGRTNDGNATAFKINRIDGSGNVSTKFFVNYAGNVGIGTTSPIAILNTSVNTPDGLGLYMENRADAGTDDKIGLAFVLRRAGGYAFNQTRIRAIKENAWTGTPSTINSALTFSTYSAESAAERMRIDSSGRLLVGTSSSLSTLAFQPNFQVEGNGAATSSGSFLRTSNDVNPSYIGLCKKRGSGGNVSNGDNIGRLMFMAFDGVNFLEAASINSFVDGVVNTQNDMPARLVFSTTQDGSNSPTERMRIDDEGIIYYNSSNHGIGTFLTAKRRNN